MKTSTAVHTSAASNHVNNQALQRKQTFNAMKAKFTVLKSTFVLFSPVPVTREGLAGSITSLSINDDAIVAKWITQIRHSMERPLRLPRKLLGKMPIPSKLCVQMISSSKDLLKIKL
jgi:hypothetical protein